MQKFMTRALSLLLACLLVLGIGLFSASAATIPGDVDNDGELTILDVMRIIRAVLNDSALDGSDVNGDGTTSLADIIRALKLIATGEVPEVGEDNKTSADVVVENGTVKEAVSINGDKVSAAVPEGVAVENGATSLTLSVTALDNTNGNVTTSENEDVVSYDVHIEGVALDNTVAITVDLGAILPAGQNTGTVALYHVENGVANAMTQVMSLAELDEHNEFYYYPATGNVYVALATFSEIALVNDTENKWDGTADYTWYNANARTAGYVIGNANQLYAFAQIVGGMADGFEADSFKGKTVRLAADIDLGDYENANANANFTPIGYHYDENSGAPYSTVYSFAGTFDGAGHTVSNFYQNTWEIKGDYDANYYNDAMGLFGYVKNGTVKNLTVDRFSSDGEFAATGVIAAYAANSTFENIAITNCNPRVYNTGNGGIVGIAGNTDDTDASKIIFENVTVDNSNKISALWGSWDVACGGIAGMFRGNGKIHFENCHVSAEIDVYNDVCANYQYYWYRYAGMIIGSVRKNVSDGNYTVADISGISANKCTVTIGDWADYYYCEFQKNSPASYSEDYQFSRVPESEILFDQSGNVLGCNHKHTETEDKQAVFLPFNQLLQGYGYGVKATETLNGVEVTRLDAGEVKGSTEKFKATELKTVTLGEKVKITDLFMVLERYKNYIHVPAVTLGVTALDENATVDYTYEVDKTMWENNTITFATLGKVKITIQDYFYCVPTEIEITVEEKIVDRFTSKFDGDFLYRVGNQNSVALGSLFGDNKSNDALVSVAVENVSGSASGTCQDGAINFSGTGVVNVTVSAKSANPVTLELLVVDAINATSAASATTNNVVLLNDCGFSSIDVMNGYALYGNGFTMTCSSDSYAKDFGFAFVTLDNGTLDNVQIVCPNFDYAALYKSNLTSSDNRKYTDSSGTTRYYNAKSGVKATGNSQILNSRISGARAAVNVAGGNLVIDNSRIELGAVASLLVSSANSVTLKDITFVQTPTASNYDSGKTLMGFSVLVLCDSNGNGAPIALEGTLVQYAWVNESDSKYVPSAGQFIIKNALGNTDYLHDLNGDGNGESLNLGIAYLPESENGPVNKTNIEDNRTNKNDVPYDYAKISTIVGSTYVYSYTNANGTAENFKNSDAYKPSKYNDIVTVMYSDTADGLKSDKSYGAEGWVYELNVDLDKISGYKLDFSKLSIVVNGVENNNYTVNGEAKPSPFAVKAGGTTYTLKTSDGKYTVYFKVTGTETSKESPSLVEQNYEAGLCVASSYGGTWSGAAPALQGIEIKYWSVAENQYKTISLSDYTPTVRGKLNGTNTTWTYSPDNGDFTLTLTGGTVHQSNSVSAMPVCVLDNNVYKLYFVASSSSGLVNSGNSARSVPVSYVFKDNNNGTPLTFSHSWSVAESKGDQYKYSDFCNGTLSKLSGSSGGSSCITPDTLVTLADGTQVRVDSLTGSEELLVWNMETGSLDSAPIMFVDSDAEAECNVINLTFSDGTTVKVIYEHGFFDYDLGRYVYLDENAADYIGHTFAKQNGDALEKVTLTDVVIEAQSTTAWSPVTKEHLCYFVNGMLSMPGGVGGLFNIFDVDVDTMTYDFDAIASDVEKYGLFTYEELNAIEPLSEAMFNEAGGAYLKISIGKGNLTMEELVDMIRRYNKFF